MILWGILAWLCLIVLGGAIHYELKKDTPRDDEP